MSFICTKRWWGIDMRRHLLYLLFMLSGFAGLGYEILWTRMLSVGLGHEIVSVLAVVCAFFSGLAIGAWLLDRPVSQSPKPQSWYGLFELVIGTWALALVYLIPTLNTIVASLIGVEPTPLRHWAISFLYPFLLLLPATVAMGGTLSAMDRIFTRLSKTNVRVVGGLYSANTLGAMAGAFLTTFFIIPALGLAETAFLLVGLNIIGAVVVLQFRSRDVPDASIQKAAPLPDGIGRGRFFIVLYMTGFLGIGFEVLMVRVLSQILEDTVFSFASILVIFLGGTAAGAAIYQRLLRKLDFLKTLSGLLQTTATACLVAVFMLRYADPLFRLLQNFFGGSFWASIGAEMGLTLLFFLLPTAAMGATFSHLAQSLRRSDGGVGQSLCLNTLGSAMAPFIFGVLLLPIMGIKFCLVLVSLGYLLLLTSPGRSELLPTTVPLTVALFIAINPNPYRFISLVPGDTVVNHHEGVMASVSVIKDKNDRMHLKVNNHFQMGGTSSVFSDWRQGLLPLLLHPRPEKALFLGLGTGATVAAAGNYPGLLTDGVELIPEVTDVMGYFKKSTGDLSRMENLHMITADARRYVSASDKQYDVIVADLFHPARDGAASLYTVEHFQAVRNRLTDEGLFCQWLPLYQMNLEMFKVIARTFLEVFPDGQAYLGHYSLEYPIIALIGAKKPLRFPENWYDQHIRRAGMHKPAAAFGYDSIYSLLGTLLAGSQELTKFVEGSPLNTDNHPVVLFQAPRFVYGRPRPAKERLLALIKTFPSPDPEGILAEVITEEDMLARDRLPAYWQARNRFIEVGTAVEKTGDVVKLYATVSEPLLNVVRMSIDFSAAYNPLLAIAYDIYPYDREASYQLLTKLARANPRRWEAGILKKRLFVPGS